METVFSYEAMGTSWKISLYEELSEKTKEELRETIREKVEAFDATYSRFKTTSLVYRLSQSTGAFEVPLALVEMLRIYKQFYQLSHKKFTPCVGLLLEDLGYDREYSLIEKEALRDVPDFDGAVEVVDDTHIIVHERVLLDLGALGKGFFVDILKEYLASLGYTEFLVDGSGDIYYSSRAGTIDVGLEDPRDEKKVIGVVSMKEGAMCSSATNRRRWGKYSHYIDPDTKISPEKIVATWVMAQKAVHADALSSLLFFVAPEVLDDYAFEYCIMNDEGKIKKSASFEADFF